MNARPLLPLALAAALLTACSTGTDPDVAAPAPAATPSTSTPSVASTAAPSPTSTAQVIEVVYAGGQISGVEQRVAVPLGTEVLIRLTSDVAEEIHVHGYDLYVDVPAGGTGEVTFTADLPGSWEVELHGAHRPMFSLRVS